MNAVLAVEILTAAVAALVISRLAYGIIERRALIAKGYGIAAVGGVDTGRHTVDARVVRVPEVIDGWFLADRPYTVITVENSSDIAGQFNGEAAARIAPDSLQALLGPTTDTGVASAAVNFGTLGFVRGVVRVGPREIRFVEPGDLLEPNYLRAVVRELVGIAEGRSVSVLS